MQFKELKEGFLSATVVSKNEKNGTENVNWVLITFNFKPCFLQSDGIYANSKIQKENAIQAIYEKLHSSFWTIEFKMSLFCKWLWAALFYIFSGFISNSTLGSFHVWYLSPATVWLDCVYP